MAYKINSYFAILLITIAGAAGALLIIHIANSNTVIAVYGNDRVLY